MFEGMDYVELAPVELTKRQDHSSPCETEYHSTHTEYDECGTGYAICRFLTYEESRSRKDDGIDGKKERVDLLPTRDQGFRGSYKELVSSSIETSASFKGSDLCSPKSSCSTASGFDVT